MPIPDSIINKTLTSVTINGRYVAPYTFYGQTNLSQITALSKIRFVDEGCFKNCSSITSGTIDFSNLVYIGFKAFENCTGLSGYLNLAQASYIDAFAFSGTNISEIRLKKDICYLSSIDSFPDTLTTIRVPSEYVDAYKSYPTWKNFADKIVADS